VSERHARSDAEVAGRGLADPPAPLDPAPLDAAPVDPVPLVLAPVDPVPLVLAPVDPVPLDPPPLDPGPLDPALHAAVTALLDAPPAPGAPTRRLLGIAGPPGAGKSTLSAQVLAAFPGRCVVVPMDGFHLAQAELERLGRADRKGAPDTFDAAGYVALLRRLRSAVPGETVYAPEYRRDLRHGVTGAVPVPAEVPLVITEGNYLLLTGHGFGPVRDLLDACWYVDLPEDVRIDRLVRRHVRFGKSPAAARAWVAGPDQRNADLVARTRDRADRVVQEPAIPAPGLLPSAAPADRRAAVPDVTVHHPAPTGGPADDGGRLDR
jgi:pantothenate kinase